MKEHTNTFKNNATKTHKDHNVDAIELNEIFKIIGLANSSGETYHMRAHKHKQIFEYIKHIKKAIKRLSTKRELVLLDCACGKSYLSFLANYYLTRVENYRVRFIGIDINPHVINASREAAAKLGYNNMTFIQSDMMTAKLDTKPDIVYSLHACDTATDMTIAKGLLEGAQYILSVSCCQHSIRYGMKKHPLSAITKHGVYKERLADMLSDSMRTLLLESRGYKTKVFEFIDSAETPKNVMVRAVNTGPVAEAKYEMLMKQYRQLADIFHTEPKVLNYLNNVMLCDII